MFPIRVCGEAALHGQKAEMEISLHDVITKSFCFARSGVTRHRYLFVKVRKSENVLEAPSDLKRTRLKEHQPGFTSQVSFSVALLYTPAMLLSVVK